MNVIFAVRACGNACAPLFFCPAALKVRRLVEGKATKVRRLVKGVTLKVRRLLNLGESLQAVNVNVAIRRPGRRCTKEPARCTKEPVSEPRPKSQ